MFWTSYSNENGYKNAIDLCIRKLELELNLELCFESQNFWRDPAGPIMYLSDYYDIITITAPFFFFSGREGLSGFEGINEYHIIQTFCCKN